jgi:hypothetical protein
MYILRLIGRKEEESFENSMPLKLPLQFHVFSDMSFGNMRSWISNEDVNSALKMANDSVFEPCGIEWTMRDVLFESVPQNVNLNDFLLLGPSSENENLLTSLIPSASVQKQMTNVYFVNYVGPNQNGKTIDENRMDKPAIFLGQFSQTQGNRRDISSIAYSLAHELCRVLGLPNSTVRSNLMYPDTAFSNSLSEGLLNDSQIQILNVGATRYTPQKQTQPNLKYDASAPIVDYHSSEAQIRIDESQAQNKIPILGDDGKTRDVYREKAQNLPTYFSPGTYPFGTANYVPIYADSVLLSKTASLQATELQDTHDMIAGFCQQEKNNPMKLEETCMAMDKNNCASSQCCILLGGNKCVAGNDQGPTNVSHYNDTLLKNKEFYYYQGKCFGNCPDNL